jgi:hypothetical protein
MIREALELAVCPQLGPKDNSVRAVVMNVEEALKQAGPTTHRSRGERVSSRLWRALTRKRIWRTPSTLIDEGPNFFHNIGVGLGEALDTNLAINALDNVACDGRPPTISEVVSRFRLELERIVRQGATPFRRRLRMMLTDYEATLAMVEREYWRYRVKQGLSTLAPPALVFGVSDAAGLSVEQAAILGAIAGGAVLIRQLARHGVGGLRLSSLKAIRSILEEAAVDPSKPPKKEYIDEIRRLADTANSWDEPVLANKLSALEHRLGEWDKDPADPSVRHAAFRALAEVAVVLRGDAV